MTERNCKRFGCCWHDTGFEKIGHGQKVYRVLKCCYCGSRWVAPSVPWMPDSRKEHGPYVPSK